MIEASAFSEYAMRAIDPFAKLLDTSVAISFGEVNSEVSPDQTWLTKIKAAVAALGCMHAALEYTFKHEEIFGGDESVVPRPLYLWKAVLYAQNPKKYERNDLMRLARKKQKIYRLLHEEKFKEALEELGKLSRDRMFAGVINQYFVEKAQVKKHELYLR
jgi:hypothetical protein